MRRGVGQIAVFTAVVLAMTVGAPVGAVEKPELPVSWMWSWLSQRPTWAGPSPSVPQQEKGSAEGGDATYADTKEDGGAGRKPTTAKGALEPYEPHDPNRVAKKTGEIQEGFDPKTSKLDGEQSTQLSDVYTNTDGTV